MKFLFISLSLSLSLFLSFSLSFSLSLFISLSRDGISVARGGERRGRETLPLSLSPS